MEQLTREWLLHAAGDAVQRQIAERQHGEYRRREFLRKTTRFVEAWNRFAHSYVETQTFNMKLAGDVEKAFREMQKDEGWLKMR